MIGLSGPTLLVNAAGDSKQARLRVVHASPDAPSLDIYINGTRAFRGLTFKEVSNYAGLTAGSYRLQVVPAGKSLAQGPVIISTTATLAAGKDYSVVGAGLSEDIEPLLLVDNNALPDPSKAKVRFVHLSPDTPSLNVVAPANNRMLFSKVGFEQAGDYVTIDAGRYNLAVQSVEDDSTLLNLKGVPVGNGQVITLFGMGLSEGQPALRAVIAVDAATTKLLAITGEEKSAVTEVESQAKGVFPVWSLVAIGLGLVLLALPMGLWRKVSVR
jgi:hypothetical protein